MNHPPRKPALRLFDYYVIEGANSFAATLFLLSLFFWTRERYGFTNTENLLLGAVQGVCYVIAARLSGRLGDRAGHDRMLIGGLAGAGAVLLVGWLPDWRPMPYLALALYTTFLAGTWPALEAGIMHVPGRINTPRRLGIYNLVWSFSGAAGFFLSGWIFTRDPDSIFYVTGVLYAAQLGWIAFHHGRHEIRGSAAMSFPHEGDRHPAATKRELLRMSWLSNSLGYFIVGGFSALTPHLGEKFGLSQSWTIWLGSSLLAARAIGFVILYRWPGWHYHRGWNLYALWSAPAFITAIFFVNHLAVVALACLGLGFSLGLSYYMSIYYSLDASDNKGEQGGLHEAIIGMGILFGPLAGAAGGYLTGATFGAKAAIAAGALLLSAFGLLWAKHRPTSR